ncbi:GGDEF domain-containing protein [Stutzerimonas nosocomialis]|uniref:diguanylate cyclase n=1 Tax=Stutzerimonas nosocomialis TaxID=1056496 RepID=A0A5R9QV91_9GAMM|nr:diguanylate cyclase [Stutzerimonas nosocomialis]TLX58773.1 GGDEF domain-containing protein [Stutzerimonas nosocomialis]TLX63255.1 GGDEF domain-containing protein [Stutzerimonas nosocomialis]
MGRPAPLDGVVTSAAPIKQSLGRRLVVATLGFCLLFTLVAVGVRSWFAWQNERHAMESELALIDQVFSRTLAKAIWEMDSEALSEQLDSVSRAAPVGRVELQLPRAGRTNEILMRSRGQSPATQRAPTFSRTLVYEPYPGAQEVVGQLILEGSESVLWERLYGQLIDIVVTQLIQSLLLAGLIMWMFYQTVTLHVRVIARHLAQLSPANLGKHLRLERSARRQDELSLLEAGVNRLQTKLSTYLERQRQDEQDLAAHRDRLAELVQARTAELSAANARLEELSRSDPLTGLANRRQFDELKDVEFRRAQRLNQPLTVLMCDVDHFKRYNDSHGHAAGDRCLQVVAETLSSTFGRAGELVARLGGEEFVVLLPGSDQDCARRAAERVQQRLAERALPHGDSPVAPHVTLSIGLAGFDAETMDRFDLLLHRADEALYRAKAQGRNRVAD